MLRKKRLNRLDMTKLFISVGILLSLKVRTPSLTLVLDRRRFDRGIVHQYDSRDAPSVVKIVVRGSQHRLAGQDLPAE
jgi:hypothetical protein